jgi:serine O-acetyltransferase
LKGALRALLVGADAARFFLHRERLRASRTAAGMWFHRFCCARIMYSVGCMIPESVAFEATPAFPHGLHGIFISQGAVIGSGCVIFQQVTIGSNTLKGTKRPGAPKLGCNVYIGAGAKIIGGVTVGDGVRIGANCVVSQDIPPGATVVAEKPRVIIKPDSGRDNSFTPWGDGD